MLALLVALATVVSLHTQSRSWSDPCESETSTAEMDAGRFTLPNRNPIQAYEILTLFRFHRQREALAKLDAAQKLLGGPFRWRVPTDQHKDATIAVAALRRCIGTHRPAPLGTLTVRESVLGYVADRKLGTIVGGTTAGANGNVAMFVVPGGFSVTFTGMRVSGHDGRTPHHLVGIKPDIPIAPTVAGVREGRDEVLDRAVALIRGK